MSVTTKRRKSNFESARGVTGEPHLRIALQTLHQGTQGHCHARRRAPAADSAAEAVQDKGREALGLPPFYRRDSQAAVDYIT
jgi:hypothetical protein